MSKSYTRILVMLLATATFAFTLGAPTAANAHCQVPCGIYDDHARVHAMLEDVATIAKAVDKIAGLAGKTDAQSLNQKVRWITTKEAHASNIIKVVAEYFLTQKIKPKAPKDKGYNTYLQMLTDHHAVMAAAMKTKQTVDTKAVDKLRKAVVKLEKWWPKPKGR